MTKCIIGEIFSSSGATLYKDPSDQTLQTIFFLYSLFCFNYTFSQTTNLTYFRFPLQLYCTFGTLILLYYLYICMCRAVHIFGVIYVWYSNFVYYTYYVHIVQAPAMQQFWSRYLSALDTLESCNVYQQNCFWPWLFKLLDMYIHKIYIFGTNHVLLMKKSNLWSSWLGP